MKLKCAEWFPKDMYEGGNEMFETLPVKNAASSRCLITNTRRGGEKVLRLINYDDEIIA